MNGFEAYKMYQAIRLHFTTDSFDYFLYNGKSKVSEESFQIRKDKYLFHKIARMHSDTEMQYFFAVNFMKSSGKVWVSGFLKENAARNYKEWLDWQKNRIDNFTKDLEKLSSIGMENLLPVRNGQFPELLNLVMQNEIAYDSLVILDDLIGLVDKWDSKIEDDFIWKNFYKKFIKYKPFFRSYMPVYRAQYDPIFKQVFSSQKKT